MESSTRIARAMVTMYGMSDKVLPATFVTSISHPLTTIVFFIIITIYCIDLDEILEFLYFLKFTAYSKILILSFTCKISMHVQNVSLLIKPSK